MTKEELAELQRERGKQTLNIGDIVRVYDRQGNVLFNGKEAFIIEKALLDRYEYYYGLWVGGVTAPLYQPKKDGKYIGETALLAPYFAENLELIAKATKIED